LIVLMRVVKSHYDLVVVQTKSDTAVDTKALRPPLVVLPIEKWSCVSERALRFGWTLSKEISVVHVHCDTPEDDFEARWHELVEDPARREEMPVPKLVVVQSPFRFVIRPILDFVVQMEKENPDRQVALLLPRLVESRWIFSVLHNNRATVLKALVLLQGSGRVVVVDIPWYLGK
jgi:hypothetical protein